MFDFNPELLVSWPIITSSDRAKVVDSLGISNILTNKYQDQFAKAYVEYLEMDEPYYCLPVSRCTHALHLLLAAYGVGPGDEVIVPAFGFSGTSHPILWLGAKPVFVDVEQHTGNIATHRIPGAITEKTKAIIVVHMHGIPVEMDNIASYVHKYGIPIIEDACQAHGATFKGRKMGTFGDSACFSTNTVKNLPSTGGGFTITKNRQFHDRLIKLAMYGESTSTDGRRTYQTDEVGFAYSMSAPDAALALSQLERLDFYNCRARINADIITEGLRGLEELIVLPFISDKVVPVWHKYRIRVIRPIDIWALITYLGKQGVLTHRWTVEPVPASGVYPHEDPLKYPQAWELVNNSFCILTETTPLAAQDSGVMEDYVKALRSGLLTFIAGFSQAKRKLDVRYN